MKDDHPRQGLGRSLLKDKSKRSRILLVASAVILVGMLAMMALVVVVSTHPATGAQGADWLRNLIGTKPVADLEALVFSIQDKFHHFMYTLKGSTPVAPWEISSVQGGTVQVSGNQTAGIPSAATPGSSQNSPGPTKPAESMPVNTHLPGYTSTPTNETGGNSGAGVTDPPQQAISTPTPVPWEPANLASLGNIPDEGVWTAYIQDASGNTVAYRTFLQPDADRPYVTVGIVAFDLTRTQLHYEPGTLEPVSSANITRTGQIPAADRTPGVLLAAFNGGFKTVHGNYGVFADGTVLVPPIDGMGTLAIFKDGSIRIGEWGVDLNTNPDMMVYRQNCPLMVHNGEINPQVYNNSLNDWGGTLSGNIVTFRSGVGISQDGKTLFYFAGNTLTMPALAKAMQSAGAYQAMQLDINNYYVFFATFEVLNGQLTGMPLLPKDMFDNINRYLDGFSHDFFYVTGGK